MKRLLEVLFSKECKTSLAYYSILLINCIRFFFFLFFPFSVFQIYPTFCFVAAYNYHVEFDLFYFVGEFRILVLSVITTFNYILCFLF